MFNQTGSSPTGGQWCPAPHLKSLPPYFTFGPPVAAYIQYYILKMRPHFCFFAPPSGFWPPLLLNLGDGPATRDEISQPSRPISPRAATGHNNKLQRYSADFPSLSATNSDLELTLIINMDLPSVHTTRFDSNPSEERTAKFRS